MKGAKNQKNKLLFIILFSIFCFKANTQDLVQSHMGTRFQMVEKEFELPKLVTSPLKIKSNSSFQQESTMLKSINTFNYWNELGFFCKLEEKIASNSKMQMKFRLGSVDYVNQLENKINYTNIKNKQ